MRPFLGLEHRANADERVLERLQALAADRALTRPRRSGLRLLRSQHELREAAEIDVAAADHDTDTLARPMKLLR